jgi:glucose-1-phosphate thymidylyltransferase
MKGIVLAGGRGSRLHPLTLGVSKHLLPLYDKPMIYYPLSILMLAGIREILVISTCEDLPAFHRLLGDGSQWGLRLSYTEQAEPRGLPEAFILAREYVQREPVCLILGDNVFFGQGLGDTVRSAATLEEGGLIFAYAVREPQRYGVVEIDGQGRIVSIEEKPRNPRSNFAIPGLYFFDGRVADYAATLSPSARGELEITDIQRIYLESGELRVDMLGRGVAWLDAGTPESLLQAANFIQAVEERQGLMVCCPEEIAFRMGYVDKDMFLRQLESMPDTQYRANLMSLLREAKFDDGSG